jgi:hypothetical protein
LPLAILHSHPSNSPSRHLLFPCLLPHGSSPRSFTHARAGSSRSHGWRPSFLPQRRELGPLPPSLCCTWRPCFFLAQQQPSTSTAVASPALLLPWARAPLPLQASSNFGQHSDSPLPARPRHHAGNGWRPENPRSRPLPPCAQLSFLLRSISLPQAPARAHQRIPSALPCSSSLPHKTAAARPTSPRCAAPRRNAAVPAAPTPSLASSLLALRACHVFGDLSKWGVEQ